MQQVVRIFTLCGPPGSGKGTLAQRCQEELNARFLSTGDLFRKHIAEETPIGLEVREFINRGELVPDALIVSMVQAWIVTAMKESNLILLDGYPRTTGQVDALVAFLAEYSNVKFEAVFFDIADDIVIDRISARLVCSNKDCQAIYSILVKQPKKIGYCDECNMPVMRRKDDDPDVVRTRLYAYNRIRNGLVDAYRTHRVPLKVLDVAYFSKDQVFNWFMETCVLQHDEKEAAL
jgi:adenylate kinase